VAVVCTAVWLLVRGAVPASAQSSTLPSPWISADVGAPSIAGTASFNQGVFSLSGAGNDIWGYADQFQFLYQQVTGDVEIVARVDTLAAAGSWSKVGVMIRADLTSRSANALALVSGSNGVQFQRRAQSAGLSETTAGESAAAPRWLRLVRAGTTLTGYSSADGGTWRTIGSATVALGSTAYVGLAITSHNVSATAHADVSNVSVTTTAAPSADPPPANLQSADVGSPTIAGTTSYNNGVYTITAAGNDIWGSSDQFRFVYQQAAGDLDVVARVNSLQRVDAWSKAGVMIRESMNANSRNAMALISGGNGYSFQWRLDAGGPSNFISDGSGAPPAWLRLVRSGQTIQAFESADGAAWSSIGTQTVAMADTVYVGIAVTSHSTSQATQAVVDQFRVTAANAPPNQPPAVTLTSPASGARFTAPASMTVSANASDPENRLARVEFFANGTRIGTDTASPYSMTWSGVATGTYSVTAVAYDADGGSATSPAVTIDVQSSSTVPQTVTFTASPDHNTTLVSSYRIDIFAAGANPNTATPLASSNVGKPAPSQPANDITVDQAGLFNALAPGSYILTVSAIGPGGSGRSAPPTPFTR
jgi:regulation of enolase protein 1 (concanavalin A-like superfamily)